MQTQNLIVSIAICILLNIISTVPGHAQGSTSVTGGFGVFEVMYAGISFQEDQTKVGIKLGTMPSSDIFSFTIDVSAHLAGHSDLSDLKPFYIKGGFTYFVQKSTSYSSINTYKDNLIILRPGREFNISNRFGINLDGGIAIILSSSNNDPLLGGGNGEERAGRILPSGSLGLYYKF